MMLRTGCLRAQPRDWRVSRQLYLHWGGARLKPGHAPYTPNHAHLRTGSAHLSTATLSPLYLYHRTVGYFNDYPFVKYSILLCAVVLGGSVAFESYSKHRKKQQPQILCLPPHVEHETLPRPAEVRRLQEALRRARGRGEGVVFLTGASGRGKTEIACQYGKQFIEQTHNFTYRFRISKPTVLCLNGSSCEQLHVSLQESALCLGITNSTAPKEGGSGDGLVVLARAVQEKLTENKVPWLIVVDNLTPGATPTFQSLFHSDGIKWNWALGHVVVTTLQAATQGDSVVSIDGGLEASEAMSLLQKLSPSTDFSSVSSHTLSPLLSSPPLALALAASTVNLYAASLERDASPEPHPSALAEYLGLLEECVRDAPASDITAACMHLYVEAAATQPRVLHTFDLLAMLDMAEPVPASAVDRHLSSSFYQLPPLEPPTPLDNPQQNPENLSYFAQLKQLLPFGNKSPPAALPLGGFDRLHFLRHCPFISFRKYSKEGFELLQVHSTATEELSRQFLERTVPALEQAYVKEAEEKFNTTAWFRQYRTFDAEKTLSQYRGSLPGLAAAGVLTHEQYQKYQTAGGRGLPYSSYLHLISHHHCIISSIISELKILDDGFASTQFSRYIEPHLSHLGSAWTTSQCDRVMCSYGLASVSSAISPDTDSTVAQYQAVLEEQRAVLGSQHPALARTLTDMAGLLFARQDVTGARNLLESALQIYQKIPPKARKPEVNLDLGLAMTSLAVVGSSQGEKVLSRELLEQALGLYQTMPEGGEVSIHQRRLVATTLTDLAHAYLTLGNLVVAKKYIELSVMAQPSVFPEGSEETVRALTVAGTVYALLGDRRESQRVGAEAGKHRVKLEKQQLVFM